MIQPNFMLFFLLQKIKRNEIKISVTRNLDLFSHHHKLGFRLY
jgi:hypothetical protein